ncbi:MAG: 16S rRNA (guanine(527)-N(7))-methyltransferase RsmG [Tepidanaerobacteraceae bacterium]|nr:16S rRNA (guanine(527)-N(7))-methyltransferase RsmG [Tepidanaerobacteraceae bacterium]
MCNDFKKILISESQKHNIVLSADKIDQFDEFRKYLIEWNKRVNLTRIVETEDFVKKHIIDSLMLTKHIEMNPGARMIDVGTGPGIPGLIIKMYCNDIKLSLIESVRKKTNFLTWIVKNMNITDVEILNERAEMVGHLDRHREKYDIVVARAVSRLNILSEICLPFARVGGVFVAMKGPSPDEEIRLSEIALKIMGGKVKKCQEYVIDEKIKRNLVIIDKLKNSPSKYSRKPGIPEKTPL